MVTLRAALTGRGLRAHSKARQPGRTWRSPETVVRAGPREARTSTPTATKKPLPSGDHRKTGATEKRRQFILPGLCPS
jgi:hypothetical protein